MRPARPRGPGGEVQAGRLDAAARADPPEPASAAAERAAHRERLDAAARADSPEPASAAAERAAHRVSVLYVLRYYPALTETFVAREIGELLARGHRVVVAALGEREDGALADELPVAVIRPPRGLRGPATWPRAARGWASPPARWLRGHQRPREVARALWLAEEARGLDVRRVHAHFAGEAAEVGLVIARSLGVPFGVTAHAVDLFRPRASLAEVLSASAPAITISEHNRAWIAARYGVDATVVRCGVPVGPAPGRSAAPRLRVVCVARNQPKKGLDLLVRAVEALPLAAELRLVSDAPELASDRVKVGRVRPGELAAVLAGADVFALAARVARDGDRDGIPVAILEAMAAGLPVIATDVSGIAEVVDDTVGWLVPPDDADALARALSSAADPVQRAERGRAARRRILERGLTVSAQVDGLLRAWAAASPVRDPW